MTGPQTLAEIRQLLGLYPGVTVERLDSRGDTAWISLRITDAASIVWLTNACEGANGLSHVYTVGKPTEGESSAESLGRLRFDYEFGVNPVGEPKLEWFGLYLIWDLAKRDVLPRAEAERLLAFWHGVPRW
jgi:hypothetical protein